MKAQCSCTPAAPGQEEQKAGECEASGVSVSPAEPSRARPCQSRGSAALALGWLSHGPATWVPSHLGPCPAAVSTASSGTHPTLRTAQTRLSTLGQGGGAGRHGGTVLRVAFGVKKKGCQGLRVGVKCILALQTLTCSRRRCCKGTKIQLWTTLLCPSPATHTCCSLLPPPSKIPSWLPQT